MQEKRVTEQRAQAFEQENRTLAQEKQRAEQRAQALEQKLRALGINLDEF